MLANHLNSQALTLTCTVAPASGRLYKWNDVCDRLPSGSPYLNLPCTKYTMLDCFSEGGFDFFLPPFPGVPPSPFPAKPSFQNKTKQELHELLRYSCQDWADIPVPGTHPLPAPCGGRTAAS